MGHWTRTLAPTGWTFSDAPEAGRAFWSGSQNILLGFTTEKSESVQLSWESMFTLVCF